MDKPIKSYIDELVEEYMTRYRSLTPEQKREADVKRACNIIEYFAGTEQISPHREETYRRWLLENFEKDYIQEAMLRYFDTTFCENIKCL